MRNPALSRVVRGLSSRTSTAAIIAGLVLVAPITNAISAGFSGNAISTTAGVSASSSSVTFNSSIAGTDHGVVTWGPSDDAVNTGVPINFLPVGETVNYYGSGAPYTILNRIVSTDTSRPVALNGTINSYLGGSPSGPNGGSIWFYAPGGILVGSGAVFNVGSLLLTASDPGSTNSFISGGTFSLAQAISGSKVVITPGAQINATAQPGSYVALIAPTVVQSGTVTVNGSAAYVAADAVNMSINQGLFDINVTLGTSGSGTVLTHDGSTTGPAATMGQETHRIYLVAVPKNDAITMLITGNTTLGFNVAGAADVVGNAIVLSAGRNIAAGVAVPDSGPAIAADISINRGTFTSAVVGTANNNATVFGSGGPTRFYSDLSLAAPVSAVVNVTASANPVQIDGSLTLDASIFHTVTGGSVSGGTAALNATNGGTLTIGGDLNLISNGTGNGSSANGNAAVGASGGSVNLMATSATINVMGDTTLSSNGFAASSGSAPMAPLQISGGLSNVQVGGSGGSIHLYGGLTASSTAMGGFDSTGNTVAGTVALGGIVSMSSGIGGTLTIDGATFLNAQAMGGSVAYGPTGGAGTGGQVTISGYGGGFTFADNVIADAGGVGGDGYSANGIGGAGTGGTVTAQAYAGTLTFAGALTQHVDGMGGFGYLTGGSGTGGVTTVQAGQTGTINLNGGVDLTSVGKGGDTPTYMTSTLTTGGNGTGGDASLFVMLGGEITAADHIGLIVNGTGGDGINGGNGTGGGLVSGIGASLLTQGGNLTFTPPSMSNPDRPNAVQLSADGFGGFGNTLLDGTAGNGGTGTGGSASAIANSATAPGTLTLGDTFIHASGLGGGGGDGSNSHDGGAGGDGIGGITGASARAGNGHLVTGALQLTSTGTGGSGGFGTNGGTGGMGRGGNNQTGLFSGSETILPTSGTSDIGAYVSNASGFGGDGGDGSNFGGNGGTGFGGNGNIISRGGVVHVASVSLISTGMGGEAGYSSSENSAMRGIGGDGVGGSVGALSTPRFMVGTVGSLAISGALTGSASGVSGTGRQSGTTTAGNFALQAVGGSLSADSVSFNASGALVQVTLPASEISAVGTGTINITNGLSATTFGDLGLYFDAGGTLNAATASLNARSVTPFGQMDTAAPAGTGTFAANTLSFNVMQDFRTTTSFTTPGAFALATPNGSVQTGNITAGQGIIINFNNVPGTHGSGMITGNLTAGLSVQTQTEGNASIGSVTAGGGITLVSGGTTSAGNLSAGRVNPAAMNMSQGYAAQVFAGGGSTIGSVDAKGEVRFQTLNGSVTTGNIVTDRDLIVLAKQNVSLGSVTTSAIPTAFGQTVVPGGIYIGHSDGTFQPTLQVFQTIPTRIEGALSIGGPVTTGTFIAASSGAFTAQSINSNDFVEIDAGGAVAINSIVSRYDTKIRGDSSATVGTMDTGGEGHIEVAGQVTVTSATAGRMVFSGTAPSNGPSSSPTSTSSPSDDGPSVVLVGNAGVSLGTASASGDIGLVSNGNVTAGNLVSDQSMAALVGGNLSLGSVTTGGGANGVYIANSSLYPQVEDTDGNAAEILFGQAPPRTGGTVSLGAISTGRLVAASAGAFTTSSIAATSSISIDSGGLATVNGAVTAPTISIGSLDLAIGSMASIGNAATTSLTLTSGGTATTIGGTTTGQSTGQGSLATTYTLDGAEAGRLHAQQIRIAASGDVTMGSLSLSGSGSATGNLLGANGLFQVQTPGSIRVVGSVNLANAASTDTLGFIAGQRFEIVTDTGQVQLLGTDGKVSGIAAITAANIAVGRSSLLTQLQSDPKFTGRDALLASAPLTGGKLDGYLQAGKMAFTVGNTLLIQNSGVGSTLAGFTVGTGGIKIANSGTSPIDVVIYGQALDATGAAIPTSAIGGVVTASQTTATANVDGCAFASGVCSPVNTGASAQTVAQTQLASITSSIQAAVSGSVGSPQGSTGAAGGAASSNNNSNGNSSSSGDDDSDGESGSKGGGGKAAAANPNVLIDTNSIGQTANTQIDTPVTSSGNTSLWSGEDGLAGATGTNP